MLDIYQISADYLAHERHISFNLDSFNYFSDDLEEEVARERICKLNSLMKSIKNVKISFCFNIFVKKELINLLFHKDIDIIHE